MRRRWHLLLAVLIVLGASRMGGAVPIVYEATLLPGVPEIGVNIQPAFSYDEPIDANYFRFFATMGSFVDLFGDRLVGEYDMSFWLFEGLFGDTSAFGVLFDSGDTGFIDTGDDEDPPNLPGPFGDPHVSFIAPSTGWYTVAVTNFLSDFGPSYDFQLQADGIDRVVPEPSSLALIWIGGLGLAAYSRKRRGA